MLARLEHAVEGADLPDEWKEELQDILESTYQDQRIAQNKNFFVYGKIYSNELLLIVSLYSKDDPTAIPTSCFLSADMQEKSPARKILNALVDATGIFLDSYFQDENWDEYQVQWTKEETKKVSFYYKVTRENIPLTLEANELLKE